MISERVYDMLLRKSYVDQIMPFMDLPLVKILTGVRRCGKSTIMLMLMEELKQRGIDPAHIVRFNFDTLEWQDATAQQAFDAIISKLAQNSRSYLFLDEIQEIEHWERLVNTLMEEAEYDVDIVVTGSNSKMMSSEITTYLTGRYISFRIHPLSFAEYLDFKKMYGGYDGSNGFGDGTGYGGGYGRGLIDVHFLRYLEFGGFPVVHLRPLGIDEAYVIVRDLYATTVYNDIVKRNEIRKLDQFERIVKFAFENVGNTFSANSIKNFLQSQQRKIDVETVYNYLSTLESAYILNRCPRKDLQGREILKTQEKYYLADISFKNAVFGYKKDDISQMSEIIVYMELCRRGSDVFVGKLDTQEIDFIAEKQGDIVYVQVAYLLADAITREREFGNLLKLKDNYPKIVISMDEVDMSQKGVVHMNIKDFCLGQWIK
jgi:predicted AAA+ superfamily ATPase